MTAVWDLCDRVFEVRTALQQRTFTNEEDRKAQQDAVALLVRFERFFLGFDEVEDDE